MLQVRVTKKQNEAEGIHSYELTAADGSPLPRFSAGAHIDVHIGNGLVRQYSICNAPQERHRYQIAVLKDPNSRGGSLAMHAQVTEGQLLDISEPRNLFPIAEEGKRHLLFAGGIGITPILAMAHELWQRGTDFELHYCFRSRQSAAFVEQLLDSPFAHKVWLHDDSGSAEQKLDAAALLSAPEPGTHLYVCGPGGFIAHIIETAQACDWPEQRVHREFFAPSAREHETDRPFEIELASTGQVFHIPAGRSAFEVLDEAGIAIESSCEQGVCGSCITRVLQGIPEHRDQFMTSAEQARNDQFTPCCSRALSPRLVLDL